MCAVSQKKVEKPVVEKDVDLTSMNTMGVHAIANQFINITKIGELKALFNRGFFKKHNPIVLGGGSNLLIVDNPDQPVLKISIAGVNFHPSKEKIVLTAGAGENWHKLVQRAAENRYGGIENLALIPGTVGAAPIQNIGAYGVELQDCFVKLTAFNCNTGDVEIFEKEDCEFGYRDSIFKKELKDQRIICDITLELTVNNHRLETSYKALTEHLRNKGIYNAAGIQDIFDAVVEIRQSKLPDPAKIGNAGSFFKNPIVSEKKYLQLKEKYSDVPFYDLGGGKYKLPAAWFIDHAGWKGKKVGKVGTYKNQALVLVNLGGATGKEIYKHAMTIRDSVEKKFGIDLNPEVNIIGNYS